MNIESKYQLIFITTCQSDTHIRTFLSSVSLNNNKIKCLILLLLQNDVKIPIELYNTNYTDIIEVEYNGKCSLSDARNILLKKYDIQRNAWYMFPDDDSSFDSSFFENFMTYVKSNVLISVKGANENPDKYFLKMPDNRKVVFKNDFKYAISVNQVIRGETIGQTGLFDEMLGVGCYFGAGEDNDYFLRCLNISDFKFCPELWNYHPLQNLESRKEQPLAKLSSRYKSYGRGVIYMLKKHNMIKEAIIITLRGYLGSIIYLLKFNLKMSYIYLVAANERFRILVKK